MDEMFFLLHGLMLNLALVGLLKFACGSAIVLFTTLSLFFANLFFQKHVLFLGMTISTSSQYLTAVMLLFFFIYESQGRGKTLYLLLISSINTAFLLFIIRLHLLYYPAPCDPMEWAMREVFSHLLILSGPSLAIFLILQLLSLKLWEFLRVKGFGIVFSALSLTLLLQMIDTPIFCFTQKIFSMGFISGTYLSKMLTLLLFAPLIVYFDREKRTNHVLSELE